MYLYICSISRQGVQMAQGCFIIELFPTEFRATTTLIGALAWSVCMSTLALFAYLLQNQSWRYLQLLVGLLGFHCIATHWQDFCFLLIKRKAIIRPSKSTFVNYVESIKKI